MARVWQVVGVLVTLSLGVVSLGTVLLTSGGGMNNGLEARCMPRSELGWPELGGPYNESALVRGQPLGFPLGHKCIFDSPLDEIGPQEFEHPNWSATLLWLATGAGAIGGLVLTARATSKLD
ncbi:hypothetical protein OH146_11465 [Salinibacterium sp. SYSU T00001]|uniref:hypothetical protein n=1 Tax=Homoserinimonas sedimenticola TaxID=2986805 RepID=UPI002235627A|nr:hypothetical protein [Salinibacterium sedimenticola]MCW4386391.1 hypothetical protein [Salinibacterium sedimenticola]